MKKAMVLSSLVTVGLLMTGSAVAGAASDFKAADKSTTTKLCMAALSDSRARLHIEMRDSGLSRKYIKEEVQCNGENIAQFASHYGAQTNANFLTSPKNRVSITDLAKSEKKVNGEVMVKGS